MKVSLKGILFIPIIIVLLPPVLVYWLVIVVRNKLFDWGILKSEPTPVPSVGIGNLCHGGAGKTPLAMHVIGLLGREHTVGLVSRGYGRSIKENIHFVGRMAASVAGDEPAMMARRFPSLQVALAAKRREGVAILMDEPTPPQYIVFDDVFQHRWVRPTVSVLVTSYDNLFSSDKMTPFGTLREPRRGYRRADLIVVSKCPSSLTEEQREEELRAIEPRPHQKVFFSSIVYGYPIAVYGHDKMYHADVMLVVTGISNPAPLIEALKERGEVEHLAFPDHHTFTKADLRYIAKYYDDMAGSHKAIITTEKDAMRLDAALAKEILGKLPVYYIPIEVAFHDGDGFDRELLRRLNA